MFKFYYHSKLKGGQCEKPTRSCTYFKDRDTLEVLLKKWSRQGWSYVETEQDKSDNDKAIRIQKYDEVDVINGQSYFYGIYGHQVKFVKEV